jgi:hypothetical protein
MPFVLTAMVVCGSWAIHSVRETPMRDRTRKTVNTGRLGLLLSLGTFMAFGMTLWALLNDSLLTMVAGFEYQPLRLDGLSELRPASQFLSDRYDNATIMFSLIAICVAMVVAQLILALLPSGVVELRFGRSDAPRRIANWLTRCYAVFDWMLGWWAYFFVGVIWLGAFLTTYRVWLRGRGIPVPADVTALYGRLHDWSSEGLSWVVFPLVGATTGLIAIGGIAGNGCSVCVSRWTSLSTWIITFGSFRGVLFPA